MTRMPNKKSPAPSGRDPTPLVAALLLLLAFAPAAAGDDLTITYWYGPPAKYATIETYRLIADAGFTHAQVGFGASEEDNRKLLALCRDSGLKAIVGHASISTAAVVEMPGWEQKIEEFIKTYRDDPTIAMWESQD